MKSPDTLVLRKRWAVIDETHLAGGVADDGGTLRKVAVCAVVANPLAGKGYVEDLSPLVEGSRALGRDLGQMAQRLLGAPVESYGKAAVVGTDGEQEHANACLTSAFGDPLREAVGGGRAWITSATKMGAAGTAIDVPLAFKDELWVRSHYDALEVRVPDAPLPGEIVVIVAVANRGRIRARLGGTTKEEALARLS